jgi:tripartite-type tricarboxylate transporter receptor subunit TctC
VLTLEELGYDFSTANMKGLVAQTGLPDDVYQYLPDRFRSARSQHHVYGERAGERAHLGASTFRTDRPG